MRPSAPRRWRAASPDTRLVRRLASALGLPPLVATLLANRGVADEGSAEAFLEPSVDRLHDPFELADMERAATRLARAVEQHEPVLVYGDADVDGLSATALLVHFLRALGHEPAVFVPNRAYHGYSFTDEGVRHVLERGAAVVVSVDHGISAHEPVAALQRAGVDVLVTDHHLPHAELPPAHAVVNPRRADCAYPFEELAGVGVAFKLACATASRLHPARQTASLAQVLGQSLAWVAMGTVADIMPLRGENRILVSRGLRALALTKAPGLAALCGVAGIGPGSDCGAEEIAFRLAPRLNAATRLGQSDLSVELVTATDPNRAEQLARRLDELNRERQASERALLDELEPLLDGVDGELPVVLDSDTWTTGLLGLVAGRLARARQRPAVLISSANGSPAKGSVRSVPGFDAHAALGACAQHLAGHGGHAMAAGFSIEPDRIEAFRGAFLDEWHRQHAAGSGTAPLEYDAELPLAALTFGLLQQIERLAPFGNTNPRPVLATRGATLLEVRTLGGDGQHLELTVDQEGSSLRAIAFGQGALADHLGRGLVADLLFTPKINRFRGRSTVELELVDLRAHAAGGELAAS